MTLLFSYIFFCARISFVLSYQAINQRIQTAATVNNIHVHIHTHCRHHLLACHTTFILSLLGFATNIIDIFFRVSLLPSELLLLHHADAIHCFLPNLLAFVSWQTVSITKKYQKIGEKMDKKNNTKK